MTTDKWAFWIDRGGTFTDLVAKTPDGRLVTAKLLSEDAERYQDAAIEGIRVLMGLGPDQEIPSQNIEAVHMGTTVATNALLERRGEPTVLVTTAGFADALTIAYQNRPDIFARHIVKPEPLYEKAIEIDERIGAKGTVLRPLDLDRARTSLQAAREEGYRAAAILLMHGYRHPDHELALEKLAREAGFAQVSVSHKVSALIKLVARGDTTVADAYLSPILYRYIGRVAAALPGVRLMFMQSNGGLAEAGHFHGKDSILSGPAGGIVGAVKLSEQAGFDRIITFDMGGTSTDVAHYHGVLERGFDRQVAGTRIRAPMMEIHTVAAGGGSAVHFDGRRFRVGPDSAGADPGPACYGRGGPLTVTDCNLLLGRLVPEFFPRVFGRSGKETLNRSVVEEAFAVLARTCREATGLDRSPQALAQGCLDIAVENMAQAIKLISVRRGYDVSRYTLCCFGGAGGQLACRVAAALGMRRVFIHPLAGVLSAYGMGLAEVRTMKAVTVEADLQQASIPNLSDRFDALKRETGETAKAQGAVEIGHTLRVHLKYAGTDKTLTVPFGDAAEMGKAFHDRHEQRYGFAMPERHLVVASLSVEAHGPSSTTQAYRHEFGLDPTDATAVPKPLSRVSLWQEMGAVDAPVFDWNQLPKGAELEGPALVINDHNTVVVERGWRAEIGEGLVLRKTEEGHGRALTAETADPVMLEIFNNLFMSIAEQMGYTLQNTSASVNMKERLDFSCAVFDGSGHLIANAPHMPVHLGSMGESVQALLRERGASLKPGQVYASNNPYKGGTHLPDITVMTPVFSEDGRELRFFTASRGHHADIGGITPGSMPPFSKTIADEGALLDNFLLVDGGRFREAATRTLFEKGPHPSRNPERNLADLKAQIAANAKGVRELGAMQRQFGTATVRAYMRHVQDYAEACVRRAIESLRDGSFRYALDNGAVVAVSIRIDRARRTAHIDFSGSSPQQPSNFNAPAAVCKAAVLYVFRTLVEERIPMNAGCLRPLQIIIPPGSMLNPEPPAAVVAGNVETSQVVTDALYGALGVLAASQGTMNNFTFGNERHQYYETVCGGSGAGPGFPGTDAVHTHMTNSRITDPEILELRFPVVLERFAVRADSGGRGKYRGGHGAVRAIRFTEPMTAAILSNRRRIPPFGLAGGESGKPGVNRVERRNGEVEVLEGLAQRDMEVGDRFVIETPGGGGFGAYVDRETESRD